MRRVGVWDEVGAGVFRRRYEALDLNVGVVVGDGEVLVVDTAVLAGEPATGAALRRAPYPAETIRMALDRARMTSGPIDSTGSRH